MLHPTRTGQNWQFPAAAGVIAILFGLAAILWPSLTIGALLILFAIYAIVYGIVEILAMSRARAANQTWWTHLLIGVIGIATGLITLFYPGVTGTLLVYFIAVWALAIGIAEVLAGVTQQDWFIGITGGVTLAVGLILFANAPAGALAMVWVVGILALVRGVLLLLQVAQPTPGPEARR
jgi:uncharacterized membrane protein HdeD (DUF308 family)